MGQTHSRDTVIFYSSNERAGISKTFFNSLGISEEDAQKLHDIFIAIDDDGTLSMIFKEIILDFKLDETVFVLKVFNVYDKTDFTFITYEEFVIALWSFCTLSNADMVDYVFDMYDTDGTERINATDMVKMLKDIYGGRFELNSHAIKISGKLTADTASLPALLELHDVASITKRYPAILYPAIALRDTLRGKTGGDTFWEKYDKHRRKICDDDFYNVRTIVLSGGKPVDWEYIPPGAVGIAEEEEEGSGVVSVVNPWGDQLRRQQAKRSRPVVVQSHQPGTIRRMASNGADILREKSRELRKLLNSITKRDKGSKHTSSGTSSKSSKAQRIQQDKTRRLSISDQIKLGFISLTSREGNYQSSAGSGSSPKPRKMSISDQFRMRVAPKKKKDEGGAVDTETSYKRERKMSMAEKIMKELKGGQNNRRNRKAKIAPDRQT